MPSQYAALCSTAEQLVLQMMDVSFRGSPTRPKAVVWAPRVDTDEATLRRLPIESI